MLDIRTILLLAVVFNTLCGMTIIFYRAASEDFPPNVFKGIGFGLFLIGVGFLLMSARFFITESLSIITGNTLIVVGLLTYSICFNRFLGAKDSLHLIDGFIVGAFISLFIFFLYSEPSTSSRIVIISIVFIYPLAKILYTLIYKVDSEIKRNTMFLRLFFIFYICLLVLRIFLTLTGPQMADFFEAQGIHNWLAVISLFLPVVTILAILTITSRIYQSRLVSKMMTDPLTGLYNRMAIMEFGEKEIADAERANKKVALVLIDIDRFKYINDSYGHLFGDQVLQSIGNIIKNALRPGDDVGRYGGDEFVLIVRNAEEENLFSMLENLRTSIENLNFPFDSVYVKVSISIGAHIATHNSYNLNAMLATADAALYEAKRNGRNSISIQ